MRAWARRTAQLHGELAEIADVRDPRWWLVAGGAALAWSPRDNYVLSDAEPAGDTFIGHVAPAGDPFARAHAARAALRELDGALPDQPLAVTIRRAPHGAVAVLSQLDVAAFAIGDRVVTHRLAARLEDESELRPAHGVPFVTITVGDEPIATARHAHRRGWTEDEGPWLGLTSAGGLSIVSTCHMIVDGYGHAWLAARIAALTSPHESRLAGPSVPPVPGALPLAIGWRQLDHVPRAIELAYVLGRILHRVAGDRAAPFSPTVQIPVAPGDRRRRVIPALASVRFEAGRAEPFDAFAARTRGMMLREATGSGLASILLGAAQAVPAPLAWKRRALGPGRQRWLAPFADVIGGRGCVSKIKMDVPVPPSIAVSSPATNGDELGGCVVTIVDNTVTWCGTGRAGDPALLDELIRETGR